MRIFLNALGASTASGLTYLRNVLPELQARAEFETVLAVHPRFHGEFRKFDRVVLVPISEAGGTIRRFWYEQTSLPLLIRDSRAEVLISAGNFALRRSPVPQILLSGNSLYTSRDFYRDLIHRREYGLWLDTRGKATLARQSIHWADCTVAPTRAFADDLERWSGKSVAAIHHGFDPKVFFGDAAPLAENVRSQVEAANGAIKLLYVTHYNYFRNFETLFSGLAQVRKKLGREIRLLLTCKLEPGQNPGAYKTRSAAQLVERLGIAGELVQLGAVPYRQLHHLYELCDLYVSPAYTETFAHPLVEAQACGLPIVASDIAVHREVCGDAALYFDRFSPSDLASKILQSLENRKKLPAPQPVCFSWKKHVDQLLATAEALIHGPLAAAA